MKRSVIFGLVLSLYLFTQSSCLALTNGGIPNYLHTNLPNHVHKMRSALDAWQNLRQNSPHQKNFLLTSFNTHHFSALMIGHSHLFIGLAAISLFAILAIFLVYVWRAKHRKQLSSSPKRQLIISGFPMRLSIPGIFAVADNPSLREKYAKKFDLPFSKDENQIDLYHTDKNYKINITVSQNISSKQIYNLNLVSDEELISSMDLEHEKSQKENYVYTKCYLHAHPQVKFMVYEGNLSTDHDLLQQYITYVQGYRISISIVSKNKLSDASLHAIKTFINDIEFFEIPQKPLSSKTHRSMADMHEE